MYAMTRKEKVATKLFNAAVIVVSTPGRAANFVAEKTSKNVNYSK